jgi:hypothetical protein
MEFQPLSGGGVSPATPPAARSVFRVRQRGMPPGFAATVILEVFGPLVPDAPNALCMLMPGRGLHSFTPELNLSNSRTHS